MLPLAFEESGDLLPRLPTVQRDDVADRRRAFLARGASVGIIRGGHAIYGEVSFRRFRLHGGDTIGVAPRIVAVIGVVVEEKSGDAWEAVCHDAADEQGFLAPRGSSGGADVRQRLAAIVVVVAVEGLESVLGHVLTHGVRHPPAAAPLRLVTVAAEAAHVLPLPVGGCGHAYVPAGVDAGLDGRAFLLMTGELAGRERPVDVEPTDALGLSLGGDAELRQDERHLYSSTDRIPPLNKSARRRDSFFFKLRKRPNSRRRKHQKSRFEVWIEA